MKKLIIVAGIACEEKKQIARQLAKQMGCAYVNKDSICKDFTDYIMKKNTSSQKEKENYIYRSEVNRLEYISTLKVCKDLIENGINVVAEMPLASQIENFEKYKLLSVIAGIPFDTETKFIWVKNDIEKELTASDSKLFHATSWNEYISLQDGLQIDDGYHCIEVKYSKPAEEAAAWIIDQLNNQQ